jgi:hypothetical protein
VLQDRRDRSVIGSGTGVGCGGKGAGGSFGPGFGGAGSIGDGFGSGMPVQCCRPAEVPLARATGLAANSGHTGSKPAAAEGHIRADIHVHGNAHKAVVKAKGAIDARLHRWPQMHDHA